MDIGFDGTREEDRVTYPYKDKASIRKRLVKVASSINTQSGCPKFNLSRTTFVSKLYKNNIIAFEKSADRDYPVNMVLYTKENGELCKEKIIDRYSAEGAPPDIKFVFDCPIKGKMNVWVIVSCAINHARVGTYGTLYQIYAYKKDKSGALKTNQLIVKSSDMTGLEGFFEGSPSHFYAKEVKTLINKLY